MRRSNWKSRSSSREAALRSRPRSSASRVHVSTARLSLLALVVMLGVIAAGDVSNATNSTLLPLPPSQPSFPWTCPNGWVQTLDDFTNTPVCIQLQLQELPAVSIEYFCENVLVTSSSTNAAGYYASKSLSIHSQKMNNFAVNLSQPVFSLFAGKYPLDPSQQFVLLGGAVVYGQPQWFDQSPIGSFSNFSSSVPSAADSACIALYSTGAWGLVSCTNAYRPFFCSFTLGPPATFAPTPPPSFPTPAPASPVPGGSPSNSTAAPPPPAPRAKRPAIPLPAPACRAGWTLSNATGKCYQLVVWNDFTGSGLSNGAARQACQRLAPKGDLTSVLDEGDTAVVQQLIAIASLQTLVPFAFVGGVFLDSGRAGVWLEDVDWFASSAYQSGSFSSPSWPTASNGYYTNWAPNEPQLPFGCIAVDSAGLWYAKSCQVALPFICSYLDDGSTYAPTAAPTTATPQPQLQPSGPTPAPTPPVLCAQGWTPFLTTRRCYTTITTQIPGYNAETACNAALPQAPLPQAVHATAVSSVLESIFVGQLAAKSNVSAVAFGLAFSQSGQILQYLDGQTNPNSALASSEWAPGQPTMSSGLAAIDSASFLWVAVPMAAMMPALSCSYSYDQMGLVTVPTPVPTVQPGQSSAPTGQPIISFQNRLQSLNFLASFYVACNTLGTYAVQTVGGSIEQFLLLFSPQVSGGPVCNNNHKEAYMAQVTNGQVTVQHSGGVFTGVVCIADSSNPFLFFPTSVTFSVLPLTVVGFIPLSQATSYSPPQRYNTSSLPLNSSLVQQQVQISRRTSGSLQVIGSSYDLIVAQLRTVRFSSSVDCMGSIYTYGAMDLQIPLDLVTYQLIDVEILRTDMTSPFDDDPSHLPPTTFFVCVAVSPDPNTPSSMYTAVPGLSVSLVAQHVAIRGMFVVEQITKFPPTIQSTVTVPQFSSPRLALDGDGLSAGRLLLFSLSPNQCNRLQLTPTNSTDPSIPTAINTIAVVDVVKIGSFSLPYVQLSLNHTGMWGVDPSVTQQVLYLCFAYSSVGSFLQTSFQLVVTRQAVISITTQDTTSVAAASSASLVLNTGFSGFLTLWGIDTKLWSLETLSNTQVAFAQHRPGSSPILPFSLQCANTSLFYGNRALNVVAQPTDSLNASVRLSFQTQYSIGVVVPPNFLNVQSMRWMRVCISVPHPFASAARTFVPTTATLDVQPVQLTFVGPFGADSVGTTKYSTIIVPENSDNVVLPLSGYGLQQDMTLFLSAGPCMPQTATGDLSYFGRTSLLNMSIYNFFDVPRSFRTNLTEQVTSQLFIVLTRQDHTNTALANSLFGQSRNNSLWVCINAPQTKNIIYQTVFQFLVSPQRVDGISNLFASAVRPYQQAVVGYGEFVDLQVFGYGVRDNLTVLVPALDCANESSFLWWSPVALSPIPSTVASAVQDFTQRYQNSQTGYASWYLPLNQQQTCRIGSQMPQNSRQITRFQWCVRYDRTDPASPFIPTGIPYTLNLLGITGFVVTQSNGITTTTPTLVLQQQSPLLGSWTKVQLSGPLIDRATATGNLIYMFLSEPLLPCAVMKKYIILSNDTDRYLVVNGNGQTLVLPSHASNAGTFKICYSILYPTIKAIRDDQEAALRFVEATGLRVIITPPMYQLFALNGTTQIVAKKRSEWLLSVTGNGLSGRTRLRFIPTTTASVAQCAQPMPGLDDIIVRTVLPNQTIYGLPATTLYMLLEREVTIGLPSAMYFACFQANPSAPWMLSSVLLNLLPYVRTPTYYNYFALDGSRDVADLRTLAPTKLVRSWNSGITIPDTVNVVGTAGREIVLQLWCYSNGRGSALQLCGTRQRVLLARPLADPLADPCFIDEDDVLGLNTKGPFVIRDGILTLPRSLSEAPAATWYPNVTDPWVMCLETAPLFFRQALTPQIILEWTTVSVTGFSPVADQFSNSTASYGTFENNMGVNGTMAAPPVTAFNSNSLIVHAQDLTQVFFLNGFGVQYAQRVRFGPNCDVSNSSLNSDLMNNSALYTKSLLVGDDQGSVVIPSTHFLLPESSPLPMCISTDNGTSFVMTQLTLIVLPSTLLVDSTLANFNDQHAVVQALSDTMIVPLLSRGLVDLSRITPKGQTNPVLFGSGSQVMLSTNCLYSAQGIPILTISQDSLLAISYAVTTKATPPLKICLRRIVQINTLNKDNVPTYVYQTPTFIDTGLKFKVLNVSVSSVSLHTRSVGVEANHDIRHLVFTVTNTETLLQMKIASSTSVLPTRSQNGPLDVSTSFDDVNVLSFLNLIRFRVGAPCNEANPMNRRAYLTALSQQTASFYKGQISVTPDSSSSFVVPLFVDPSIVATPWAPLSVCMTVDGGRQFISVGIAYFTATWAPTLLVAQRSQSTPSFIRQRISASWTSNVVVYESTAIQTKYTDSRYDARVFENTASDFVDTELSRELDAFTVAALWTGFIGGVGYCESGSLYLPSQIVSDSSLVNISSPAIVSSQPQPLSFYFDANNNNIATGITLSTLPMSLNCLDGLLTNITVHREEPGRLFSLSDPRCAFGLNDGQSLRLVPVGASCMTSAYAVDLLIDGAMNAILPFQTAFLPDGTTYQLCFSKYLPLRVSLLVGQEAVKVPTPIRITVSHSVLIDSINGLSAGTLVAYQGCSQTITVTGSGLGSNSVVLSAVTIANKSTPLSNDLCAVASTFMNSSFLLVNGSAQDPLSTWFPVVSGAVTIPASATGTKSTAPRVLCYSADSGITFQLAGSGIFFIVVPPVVTSVNFAAPDGRQLYDPDRGSKSLLQLLRISSPIQPPNPSSTLTAFSHALPTLSSEVAPPFMPFTTPLSITFGGNGFLDFATAVGNNPFSGSVVVSFVRTATQGSYCDGLVPAAALAASFQVNLLRGTVLNFTARSPVAAVPALFASYAPSEPLLVCTSVDGGATHYSANAPSLQIPSAPVISATNRYNTSVVVVRLDAEVGQSSRIDDISLLVQVAVRASTSQAIGPLSENSLAETIARLIGVDSSLVIVYVTTLPSVTIPNGTSPQTAQMFDVAVKITAPSIIQLDPSLNLSWVAAAPSSASIVPIPSILTTIVQIIRDNSTVVQTLLGSNQQALTVSALTSRFVFSDGVLLTQKIRDLDASTGLVSQADLSSYDLLIQFSLNLLSSIRQPVVSMPPSPSGSSFSAVPIILLVPFLLIFATYEVYVRFLLVETADQKSEATRKFQSAVAAFTARRNEKIAEISARLKKAAERQLTPRGQSPSNSKSTTPKSSPEAAR